MLVLSRVLRRISFLAMFLVLVLPTAAAASGIAARPPVTELRAQLVSENGVQRVMLSYKLPRTDGSTVRIFRSPDGFVTDPEADYPFPYDCGFLDDRGVYFDDLPSDPPTCYYTVYVKYPSGWSLSATAVFTTGAESAGARDAIPGMPIPNYPFQREVSSSLQDPETGDGYGVVNHEVWRVDLAEGQVFAAEFYMIEIRPYSFMKTPPSWVLDMYPPGTSSIAAASKARVSVPAEHRNAAWPLTTYRYTAPTTGTYYFVVRIPKQYLMGDAHQYAVRWWRGSSQRLSVRITKVWFYKYASGARVIRYRANVTPTAAPLSLYGFPTGWWPRAGKVQRWNGKKWVVGDNGVVKVKNGGVISGQFYAPRSRRVKVRLVIPRAGLYAGATSNTKTARR